MSRRGFISSCAAIGALVIFLAAPAGADRLDSGSSWENVSSQGLSLVFGRFIGRFEGPDFRNRRIEIRRVDNGKDYYISVGEGLGYFEEVLPPGSYNIVGLEATYFPPQRPIDPLKYRPVQQRLGVRAQGDTKKLPAFYVSAFRPVYLGTIQLDNQPDGIVYRGHYLRIYDELADALERLGRNYPALLSSLQGTNIVPSSHFVLKPTPTESPLELVDTEDPIRRAREYVAEGRFKQAINWLRTFMPTSDEERAQARMLIGEALLGDGEYQEAIERLGDVLEPDPENLRALRLLARAHAYNNDLDDALGLYEALAEALPGDTEAHLQLGYMYALRSERSRSAVEFSSAFECDMDYLLHDVGPLAMVLKAVNNKTAEFVPPKLVGNMIRPPTAIQSRRNSRGGLALLIDHEGKLVAARVNADNSVVMPVMMLSVLRATFKPAAVNGVPVPALILMDARGWASSSTR